MRIINSTGNTPHFSDSVIFDKYTDNLLLKSQLMNMVLEGDHKFIKRGKLLLVLM